MLEIHRTREGDTMLIAQMSDEHLTNMISMVIRKARQVKEMADSAENINAYHAKLYGVRRVTQEDAAQATREALQKLYPYLAEAYLRDLAGPRTELAAFLGRDAQIETNVPLLAEPNDPYDDYGPMPIDGEEAREMAW
jgi:hypothetical protein